MKVETTLTPKQAVLLWLADARKKTLVGYSSSVIDGTTPPREHIADAVGTAVETAMKGERDRQTIARAVRQAQEDGDLLVCIVLEANESILNSARADALQAALLTEQMKGILEVDSASNEMQRVWGFLSFETAYPLDLTTASAYAWMRAAWVHPQDLYREDLEDWVRLVFIRQGKRPIPSDAISATGSRRPWTDAELLQLFPSADALAAFRDGTDFTHELADVPDADFDAALSAIDTAFDALVADGTIATGTAVELELPTDATWIVPLLEDAWLDAYLLELAEWHAALLAEGWTAVHPDGHDLAWHDYRRRETANPDTDWTAITPAELDAVREAVRGRLATFTGRTRTRGGRLFWSLADYQSWPGRKAEPKPVKGVLASSWHKWLAAHGGPDKATLAGVPVRRLSVLPRGQFAIVDDDDERRANQAARLALFDRIRPWLVDKADIEGQEYIADRRRDALFARMLPFGLMGFKTRIADWRVRAMAHASEVFRLRAAIERLQTKYFDGHPILFPDVAQDLERQVTLLETVVGVFNETIANRLRAFQPGELLTGEQPADNDRGLPAPLRTGFEIDLKEVATLIERYVEERADDIVKSARATMLQNVDIAEARAYARLMHGGTA